MESLNFELLDLLGIGYVIDHYIAFFRRQQEDKIYRIYMTEGMRMLTENAARIANGGSYINKTYAEMIEPPKKETRTSGEIIENIRDKLRRL